MPEKNEELRCEGLDRYKGALGRAKSHRGVVLDQLENLVELREHTVVLKKGGDIIGAGAEEGDVVIANEEGRES